ncbi:MAG: hypothetical protein ACKOC5_05665 [Chloroflexota bacterium]
MDDETQKVAELAEQARMLVQRLERVSVDSIWARRASGHRGALLKCVEELDRRSAPLQLTPGEAAELQALVAAGFWFLERAAKEKR